MKIAISCDSVCDLPKDILKYYDIKTMPCQISMADNVFYDTIDIQNQMVYDFVSSTKTLPTTSSPTEQDYLQHFNKILKNYDALIHICASSNLSNNYSNASSAIRPLKNAYVIDSLSISAGLGLLAIYASTLTQGKLQPKTIAQKLNERKKHIYFGAAIPNTTYLNQSDKQIGTKALGNNLLNIKPSIEINSLGELVLKNKYRGKFEEVIASYINDTIAAYPEMDKNLICLVYSDIEPKLKQIALDTLNKYQIETIIECNTSSAIASHCGKNALGLALYKQVETPLTNTNRK